MNVNDESLSETEAARIRRRDHAMSAKTRVLMRTGTAKVFAQIIALQVEDARKIKSDDRLSRGRRRQKRR